MPLRLYVTLNTDPTTVAFHKLFHDEYGRSQHRTSVKHSVLCDPVSEYEIAKTMRASSLVLHPLIATLWDILAECHLVYQFVAASVFRISEASNRGIGDQCSEDLTDCVTARNECSHRR